MSGERVSAKQYGVRYGRKVRERVGKISLERRLSKACPYCSYRMVERVASGIWHCRKCGSKFTGRAYSVSRKADEAAAVEGGEKPAEVEA